MIEVSSLLDGGPEPSADEVAAIIVALAMQRTATEPPPAAVPPSRWRLAARRFEPHDEALR